LLALAHALKSCTGHSTVDPDPRAAAAAVASIVTAQQEARRTGRQLQKLQKQTIFAENRARKQNGSIQMSHSRIRFKFVEHTSLLNRQQGSVFYYSHQAPKSELPKKGLKQLSPERLWKK
jgi:hypothetical protein